MKKYGQNQIKIINTKKKDTVNNFKFDYSILPVFD